MHFLKKSNVDINLYLLILFNPFLKEIISYILLQEFDAATTIYWQQMAYGMVDATNLINRAVHQKWKRLRPKTHAASRLKNHRQNEWGRFFTGTKRNSPRLRWPSFLTGTMWNSPTEAEKPPPMWLRPFFDGDHVKLTFRGFDDLLFWRGNFEFATKRGWKYRQRK